MVFAELIFSSPSPQGHCLCSGQRHLSEGGEGRGGVPVRAVDGHRDLQERPSSNSGMQQTRCDNLSAVK